MIDAPEPNIYNIVYAYINRYNDRPTWIHLGSPYMDRAEAQYYTCTGFMRTGR